MKHIKTFSQLKESVNEAVSVDTIRYKRSHGKEPRGTGQWAFYFDRIGGDPIFTPTAMSYVDAVKWAKEEAKKAGKSTVYVGESVESLTEEVNPKVKEEVISRLADFFRVSPNALKKFNFDGNDNIKELTRALNSTSDQGTKLYYDTAIKLAKEELGIDESAEFLAEMNMMLPNISDVDHTRIVKWMGQYYDYPKQYDIKRKGKDLEITIKKMSSQEIEDLKDYLKSQNYINEAYSGNMSDFKYDLDMAIGELGISGNAIKKVSKSGKGYEVRMSSYMSQRGTWEKIGELIGATLVDFKPDPKSINVGIYEKNNPIIEALKVGDFVRYKKDNDFTGGKIINLKSGNAIVKNWDGSESEFKLGDLEYVKSWNESKKGGWINTKVQRKDDEKVFTVYDFKNYGSYQELFVKSDDGEAEEITLGRPHSKNDFFKNWKTNESVNEAWFGPFQFNDKMSDEELKKMYDDAVSGYANWQRGFQYPKSDYKKAYQEIEKILKKRGVKVDESINEREYSDEQRMDMADKGLALPDGSFPIKDLEDLKNAIQAYGRSKDQSSTAKFIVKRAKALSAEDLIPDTEDFQKALKETITEGNAFLAARAKAIEEDAEEFEFNGKKYPILNRPKKLNEALSDKDAYKILDIGSEFSKEVGGHLLATQTFSTANDLVDYLLSEFIPEKDHKEFLKRIK